VKHIILLFHKKLNNKYINIIIIIYLMLLNKSNIVINNLQCAIGQRKYGVQYGGDFIINKINNLPSINHISFSTINDYLIAYQSIYNNLTKHKFCINIGGDHSVGLSTVQPLLDIYHDDVLIIWIDAHGDINTPDTSPSQNLHGMPVSALLGLMDNWLDNKNHHKLNPKNLVYVGVRDLDPGETTFIKNLNISCFNNYSDSLYQFILNHPAKYIHISCDIDGIDPISMPSTGTVVKNGLCINDVIQIINNFKYKLISFDLVEFNPYIGSDHDVNITLTNILQILNTII
jgi:arginase